MSQDIYGVFIVHPDDAMKPGWQNALPDTTGDTVRFFETLDGAEQAIVDCSKGDLCFLTSFGSSNTRLAMGSIGVIYRVGVAQEVIEYAHQQKQQKSNKSYLFSAPLPVSAVRETTVILPSDVLNIQRTVQVDEVSSTLSERQKGMTLLCDLIKTSGIAQTQNVNIKDKTILNALRFLYGANGLMTAPELMLEYESLYEILSPILLSPHAHIRYALVSCKLRDIFDEKMAGATRDTYKECTWAATQAVVDELSKIANSCADFKTRSALFTINNQLNKLRSST